MVTKGDRPLVDQTVLKCLIELVSASSSLRHFISWACEDSRFETATVSYTVRVARLSVYLDSLDERWRIVDEAHAVSDRGHFIFFQQGQYGTVVPRLDAKTGVLVVGRRNQQRRLANVVAEAFVPRSPRSARFAEHIDGNQLNVNASNLRWPDVPPRSYFGPVGRPEVICTLDKMGRTTWFVDLGGVGLGRFSDAETAKGTAIEVESEVVARYRPRLVIGWKRMEGSWRRVWDVVVQERRYGTFSNKDDAKRAVNAIVADMLPLTVLRRWLPAPE
jgi:hypothetical protein